MLSNPRGKLKGFFACFLSFILQVVSHHSLLHLQIKSLRVKFMKLFSNICKTNRCNMRTNLNASWQQSPTLPFKIPCWRILPAISLRLQFKTASWHVLHGSFTNNIGQWGSRGPYWGSASGWQVQEPHFSLDPDRGPVKIQHTVELCATDFSTKCENQLCRLRFPLELGRMSIGKTNFLLMVKNSR